MASAPIPGFTIGSTICVKILASDAPSIREASSISPGTPSENCFIRKTPKGHPTVGKITARIVLYNFKKDICRIKGIKITCFGSAMAQTIRVKRSVLPLKRFFARAYPAMDAVTQVRTIADKDMNTVLKSQRTAPGTFGPKETTVFPIQGRLKLKSAVGCLEKSFL